MKIKNTPSAPLKVCIYLDIVIPNRVINSSLTELSRDVLTYLHSFDLKRICDEGVPLIIDSQRVKDLCKLVIETDGFGVSQVIAKGVPVIETKKSIQYRQSQYKKSLQMHHKWVSENANKISREIKSRN